MSAPRTLLAPLLLALAAPAQAWELREKTDEISDEKWLYAAHGSREKAIGIACLLSRKYVSVKVNTGKYLNMRGAAVPVQYRIDKEPAVREHWNVYANKVVTTAGAAAERFARALMLKKSLALRAPDYKHEPHTVKFDLIGAQKPIQRVLDACRKPEPAVLQGRALAPEPPPAGKVAPERVQDPLQ